MNPVFSEAMRDWMRERERLLQRAEGNFKRSLNLMRSKDPQLSEDGFSLLGPLAHEHIEELIVEYRRPGISDQYWILELIADSGSHRSFDVLVEALDHDREEMRRRAATALHGLGSKKARRLLFERGLLRHGQLVVAPDGQ